MQAFKIKSLKKISAIVAAAIGMAAFQPAQAALLTTQGRVGFVAAGDLAAYGANTNFITLVGVNTLGTCGTFLGGVAFILKDDLHGQQMYATALAAAASGSTLLVWVDDASRDANGNCYAKNVFFVGN